MTRSTDRRDRGPRRRWWRRPFLALVGVGLAIGVLAGALWVFKADLFPVTRVVVTPTSHVSDEQISQAVGSLDGRDLLTIDTAAVTTRLRAIPYVREAHVYRRFPDALEVRLSEYAPIAEVRGTGGSRWLVSDDGRVLARAARQQRHLVVVPTPGISPSPGERLPVHVVQALAVAQLLKDPAVWPAGFAVNRLEVSARGRCTLVFPGGEEVRLGQPTDLKQKLTLVLSVIKPDLKKPLSFEYVDISSGTHIVTRPKGS